MIRLVINADDLGLHPAIDEGILEAHREGLLTSATVLAMGPNAADAVARARAQGLALGLHLCLSTRLPPAAPAGAVPTVAPGGRMRQAWSDVAAARARGQLDLAEVEREFRAQLQRLRDLGAEPDHLDGHQHLHLLPGIAAVVGRIARDHGLPVRWPRELPEPSWLRRPGPALKTAILAGLSFATSATVPRGVRRVRGWGVYDAGGLSEARLLHLLDRLPPGDHELGCHPGHAPSDVPEEPGWRYGWELELAALCSPKARAKVEARGIQLTTYAGLTGRG
ncbi:MAG TPA: ChbG/HpnK family deacetylase [Myxococcaceae bacterium]|nr:ChbG/HpnK family deacetylase [Myxococcaceae bacterium]